MNYSKFRFTLDIHKHQSQVSIPVMYGDTAVQLFITLSDGGMPYTIGKSCWAQFIANKPSVDEPLIRACIIEDGTTIRLDFDSDIATVAGVYNCEVRLYGAEGILTSPCFTMVVDPRVTNSIGMDSGEATDLIDQIGLAMSQYKTAEDARESAEQGRVDAEAERVRAEEERQAAHNSLVSDVNIEVFDDGSIILQAFDSTGNAVSQSAINSIGTDTIADQAITSKKIAPGAVKNSHLAMESVSTAELCDGAVTVDKLDPNLSGRIDGFDKTDADLDRRISQIEEHISDDYFVTDEATAYNKAVPERACTYAKLASFGGMTYKCNNLLPYPYYQINITRNGITFTDNGDGSITLNGKAEGNAVCYLHTNTKLNTLVAGKTYIPSLSNPAVNGSVILMCNYTDAAEGVQKNFTTSQKGAGVYPSTSNGDFIYLLVLPDTVLDNVTVYPMINEGSAALPFEPYFEGLRDSKVTEVKNHGANLMPILPVANQTINGVTFTLDNDGVYHLSGTATGLIHREMPISLPAGTYTLSLNHNKVVGTKSGDNIGINVINATTSWRLQGSTHQAVGYYHTKTETEPLIGVLFSIYTGVNCDSVTIAPMLNEGDYIPYKPYREPISYPIPAAIQAINGYGKDGFVIDLEKQTSAYEGSVTPLPVSLEPIIEVEGGGSLEFVNEYKNAVPSAIKYLLKEESSV